MLAGAQIGYHFTDWIGLTAFFDYNRAISASATPASPTRSRSAARPPSRNRLSLPSAGRLQRTRSVASATWRASRPRSSRCAASSRSSRRCSSTPTSTCFGGVAFAGVEERSELLAGRDQRPCSGPGESARRRPRGRHLCRDASSCASRMAHCAHLRRRVCPCTSPTSWALTLEYRAFPFKWNTSGTDEGGQQRSRQPDNSGEFPGRQDQLSRPHLPLQPDVQDRTGLLPALPGPDHRVSQCARWALCRLKRAGERSSARFGSGSRRTHGAGRRRCTSSGAAARPFASSAYAVRKRRPALPGPLTSHRRVKPSRMRALVRMLSSAPQEPLSARARPPGSPGQTRHRPRGSAPPRSRPAGTGTTVSSTPSPVALLELGQELHLARRIALVFRVHRPHEGPARWPTPRRQGAPAPAS